MSCLILDTCKAGTLLHLLCHSIFSCRWIAYVVKLKQILTVFGCVAIDNCTAIPSVTVPLGRSCSIIVWCSVGMFHPLLCPTCLVCGIAPGVESTVSSLLLVRMDLRWNNFDRVTRMSCLTFPPSGFVEPKNMILPLSEYEAHDDNFNEQRHDDNVEQRK